MTTPQTAHTSGPWAVSGNGYMVYRRPLSDDGRPLIAELYRENFSRAEILANARLIAAAPDLLAAAEAALVLAGRISDWIANEDDARHAANCSGDPCTCWVASAPEVRDTLESAIAGAKP